MNDFIQLVPFQNDEFAYKICHNYIVAIQRLKSKWQQLVLPFFADVLVERAELAHP